MRIGVTAHLPYTGVRTDHSAADPAARIPRHNPSRSKADIVNMILPRKPAPRLTVIAALAAVTLTAACEDPGAPGTNQPGDKTQQGMLVGGILGAVTGALVSGDGAGAIKGAVLGAGVGAAAGYSLDKQEAELRSQLGGGATIRNTGDRLIVTMPQDILFPTDSATLNPSLRADLQTVARSLLNYPASTVQVLGHTDDRGTAAYNYDLSQRRAAAVSSVLIGSGVPATRIQTIGRGFDQPVASNASDAGRALNRRVDIVILPNV